MRGHEISWPKAIILPAALVFLFVMWGFVQAYVPITQRIVVDGLPVFKTISVNPMLTANNTLYFLAHLLFFLGVFALCIGRAKAIDLLKSIGIASGIYATYGFIVYISGNDTILWIEKWENLSSLTSTFVNRNNYAAYAGIGLQCLVAYMIFWTQDELAKGLHGRELFRHFLNAIIRKVWWLPLAISITLSALLLSNSRAGFGSIAISVFILVIISLNRNRNDNFTIIKPVVTVAIMIALIAVFFAISGEGMDQRLQRRDVALDIRFKAYPYMIQAIMDQPLTGFGLGSFDEVFRVYRGADVTTYFDRAHNDYLEIVMNAGIPAAIIIVVACALPLITLLSALKQGAQYRSFIALGITVTLQLGLHSLVDFSLQIPAVSYTWVTIIAASLAIAIRCRKENIASC
tara:strand:- start:1880 stop:3091 length:1212 start_codon:yes stop_codon:yes gene_type:complete